MQTGAVSMSTQGQMALVVAKHLSLLILTGQGSTIAIEVLNMLNMV